MLRALHRQIKFAPTSATWPAVNLEGENNGGAEKASHSQIESLPPNRQLTQQEQDEEDNQKKREALRDLVESWMDRLQLISVITTFFASTEASMLSISAPGSDGTTLSIASQLANIGIVGSLVVHSSAAIISFLAAFFLISYKLKVASSEERQAEMDEDEDAKHIVESPISMGSAFPHHAGLDRDQEKATKGRESQHSMRHRKPKSCDIIEHETDPIPGAMRIPSGSARRTVWSSNPHLVQVGPFQNNPPTHLLRRCHTLCIILTTFGFVLALMGILCLTWDRLPRSVSVSATSFMAICVLSGIYILAKPYPPEGTSPHIYVFDEL